MPIKVDISNNRSEIKVNGSSSSEVKVRNECGTSSKILESQIKHLQKHKEDIGFIFLDGYINENSLDGTLPKAELDLLSSYLINKVSYLGNIYYLNEEEENTLIYFCAKPGVEHNKVDLNKETGYFEITETVNTSDHSALYNLDYLRSGHTGFAGIEFGTTAEWNARPDYRPVAGMIVVYTDYDSYVDEQTGETIYTPGIKIGDGNAYLIDKAFVGGDTLHALENHIADSDVHVTLEEKEKWNNKVTCIEPEEGDDLLIFTKD